jgi:O-antigen/teichoic acid export membrane protein
VTSSGSDGVRTGAILAMSLSKLVPGLVLFLAVPLWLNWFGTAEYGRYALVWVGYTAASAGLSGWVRQAALRFAGVSEYRLRAHPPLVLVSVVLGVAVLPTAVFASLELVERSVRDISIFCVYGASVALLGLSQVVAQRDGRNWQFSLAEWLRALLTVGLSWVLSQAALSGVEAILAAAACGNAAGALVSLLGVDKSADAARTWGVAKVTWAFGWPMSVWLLLSTLTLYVDRIILGLYVDERALGSYAALSDIVVRGIAMVSVPVVMVLHPVIMRSHNRGDSAAAREVLRRWSVIMGCFVAATASLAALAGPQVIVLFGLPEPDRLVLLLLVAGAGLWQYALLAHKRLEMAGRTLALMWCLALALLIEVVWSAALVPLAGARGAAGGVLIGTMSYLLLVGWLTGRREEVARSHVGSAL